MALQDGHFTDEMIKDAYTRVGSKYSIPSTYNDYATKARIKAFVDGIGDVNPLFQNEAYAKNTRYGGIVAPPSWIYSLFTGAAMNTGMRGIHGFHSADDLEFLKPVLAGDLITGEVSLGKLEEKKGKFAGRMFMEYHDKKYFNQRNELVTKGTALVIRTERSSGREKKKYSTLTLPHPWTEKELLKIEDEILAEEIRGSDVRYWEDVKIHEKLPSLVKGPLGLTDMIAFMMGTGGPIKAHGALMRLYHRNRGWGFRDPETHSVESMGAVHYNKIVAKEAGLPSPYEIGVQRNCWLIQSLTDWIGDEGWLKKCYAEYRKFIYLSDVVWIEGEVARKYMDENGEHCVDIEITALNQRSENTTVARATAILPSRETQTFPVAKRLPNLQG